MKKLLVSLVAVGLMVGGCATYTPPSAEQMTAMSEAYKNCMDSDKITVQSDDPRDAMMIALINKLPSQNDCKEIFTSGDQAQVQIAASNASLWKQVISVFGIVGGVVADGLSDKWLADSVGKSAGVHTTGDGNTSAGGDINQTTSTETSYAPPEETVTVEPVQ